MISEESKLANAPGNVAVVIPCYNVVAHILGVISNIGPEVARIYVVDDKCPQGSGKFVEENSTDPRVEVIYNETNQGVGGAVMNGYSRAIRERIAIVVKMDGDGQMDASNLSRLIAPIVRGDADYTKGNRFYDLSQIGSMPPIRLVGNAVLSFMAKFSTGYWGTFDPANGYTAVAVPVLRHLPFEKISRRYFFETDILFRLNTLRAVVVDVPMHAIYGDEKSNLRIGTILPEFLLKHARNFGKRIFYNYFLRDMSVASMELLFGVLLSVFGAGLGVFRWLDSMVHGVATPFGVIMFAALPILIGLQLILAFLAFDIANVPRRAIAQDLPLDKFSPVNDKVAP